MAKYFSATSFSGGVVVGALLATAWFYGSTLESLPFSASLRSSSDKNQTTLTSDLLAVDDQRAGSEVVVKSVTVPPPGVWVAVREVREEELGNVLGAARVGSERTDVTIPLLRATEPGRNYAVMLYRDDNNGTFDPTLNSTYIDFETGSRVVVRFTTEDSGQGEEKAE